MREIVVDNFAGGGSASTDTDGAGAGKPAGAVPGEEERMTHDTENRPFDFGGYTMEEMIEAVDRLAKMMKPLDESDIERIRLNPSLSRFQKWKLTREVRRAIRKQKKSPNV